MNSKTRNVPPRASTMFESLRGLGYSTASALADIIDNSISAHATEVYVNFEWKENLSSIYILDNGIGMSDAQLECAMRLGDKSPLVARESNDLGRFGMGLKTASLSQCRRLTVASLQNSHISCLRWDLDLLAKSPEAGWLLHEGLAEGSEGSLSHLNNLNSGTLVLWELLDRIITPQYSVEDFLDLISNVESHLAMVFHRLLQGPNPRLRIFLNKTPIKPWDPFMTGHIAKPWSSPVTRKTTSSGVVEIECHVLPHQDKLSTKEFEFSAGPSGWTMQQGFYVYRNERLLVAGGWLGIGSKKAWNREEVYRLARIRIDIPNTADSDWKIDIRKSIARPPVSIRPWLTKYAEDTRERARKVFAFRGAYNQGARGAPVEQAWRTEHSRGGVKYKIDQKHPAISAVLESAGANLTLVKAMLRVIEETVPVQKIWLDTAENKDTPLTGFAGDPPAEVKSVLITLFEDMVQRKGMSKEIARNVLIATEPFSSFPELVKSLT
jgi:hypothetical protein